MIDALKNVKRFEDAYDELKEKLWLVRSLASQGIGYEKLAPHLQKDADKRMGIVRWVNVPIFENDVAELPLNPSPQAGNLDLRCLNHRSKP